MSRRLARWLGAVALCLLSVRVAAQQVVTSASVPSGMVAFDTGRFHVVHSPADARLARAFADSAIARDTFPWLPRPRARVEIVIAPDDRTFRALAGRGAPEWGIGFAFPEQQRLLMHGRRGGKGDSPFTTLRHELAHLALAEAMGRLPPRWFDEGYASVAAGEWGRDEVLQTNFALAIALGRMPTLAELDSQFEQGTTAAQSAYAFSYRAVSDLAARDPERGLGLLFKYWSEDRSLEIAVRRAYGITLTGFEQEWHGATRRRYGGLALVTDVGAAAVLGFVLVGPLWLIRRRRTQRRLEALRAADALQAAQETESALAALLGEGRPQGPD